MTQAAPCPRRQLSLATPEAIAAEVARLRAGYTQTANWNLPQICWHLNTAMTNTMRPGPHPVPAIDPAVREKLAHVLATGTIPTIQAPTQAIPPADTPESAIDQFLITLERFKNFPGPFAPHRVFGVVEHQDFIRLHHIHAAHHLSYLVPTTQATA